ncbi:MAG: hypothetical protein GC181_07965 [Bacteroidetes bacterium]|nr:hypothetical protein [Bacteroidota bacterium]
MFGWPIYLIRNEKGQTSEQTEKSLDTETVYDPITGAHLTLEQLESGKWDLPEEFPYFTEDQLALAGDETEEMTMRIVNRLLDLGFKKVDKTPKWHFKTITLHNNSFNQLRYHFVNAESEKEMGIVVADSFSYLVLIMKIPHSSGHYYFRQKELTEKFYDVFNPKEAMDIGDYKCFPISQGEDSSSIEKIVEHLIDIENCEIEIYKQHLMIRSTDVIDLDQIDFMLSL